MLRVLYDPWLNLALALGFLAMMLVAAFHIAGMLAMIPFAIAFGGGGVAWLLTTFRRPVGAEGLVVPTLLTVILFVLHVAEEYYTQFHIAIAHLAGTQPSLDTFLGVAAFGAPILWISAVLLLMARHPFGNYLIWAFFIGMLLAELTHFIFPFVEDGTFHYFSGMYTAILPLIPAYVGFRRLLRKIGEQWGRPAYRHAYGTR